MIWMKKQRRFSSIWKSRLANKAISGLYLTDAPSANQT
jgi:hypothetical protein